MELYGKDAPEILKANKRAWQAVKGGATVFAATTIQLTDENCLDKREAGRANNKRFYNTL